MTGISPLNITRHHHVASRGITKNYDETLRAFLKREGFVDLTETIGGVASDLVPWFDPFVNAKIQLAFESEIFTNLDLRQIIAFRQGATGSRVGRRTKEGINFVMASEEGSLETHQEALNRVAEKLGGGDLAPGSLKEEALFNRLSENLGSASPNGKRLKDESFLVSCRAVYGSAFKEDLKSVTKLVNDDFVTKDTLSKLKHFQDDPTRLENFLNEPGLLDVKYGAKCEECGSVAVNFGNRQDCEQFIHRSDGGCGQCDNESFAVVEQYGVKRNHLTALSQGMWLEALAMDRLILRTDRVWAGMMVGSDEVDCIAVYSDRIVLVECKDTSFGQNELYVTRAKADNIGASEVIVLTTSDIHQNVEKEIEKINSARRDRGLVDRDTTSKVNIVSKSEPKDLISGLDEVLDQLDRGTIRRWFVPNRLPSYLYDEIWID